ncbi:MAG TPA: hypothetical protein VGG23_02940, partial [Acidimicrobiales bacterium]
VLVGSNVGGTLNISVFGGSILYNGAASLDNFQRGIAGAGGAAPATVLQAHDYVFAATGAGSIGTDLVPIQTTNFGTDGSSGGSNFTLNAGDGGVYLTDWGAIDATLANVSATGPGNVRVVTGNAGTHNMFVSGNVSAVNGSIFLASDDNLSVGAGVVIGGPSFSGTVWMQANRDQANGSTTAGQFLNFDASSFIQTSNTTNVVTSARTPSTQAVYLDIAGDVANASSIDLGNITVGDGGRIVVNAIPHGLGSESGQILNAGSAILNAGPDGTIDLTAGLNATIAGADAVGDAFAPLIVAGGTVLVTANFGNVTITGNAATTFSAPVTASVAGQTGTIAVNLSTTAGAVIIGAAGVSAPNAAISLNPAAGAVIAGPLSGGAAGSVTVFNDTTFQGVAETSPSSFSLDGAVNLTNGATLAPTGSSFAVGGAVSVAAGTTFAPPVNSNVNGAIAVAAGATFVPAGVGTTSALDVVGLQSAGALDVDLLGTSAGSQYDQLDLAGGTANIAGTTLNLMTSNTLTVGQTFTLISNSTGQPIVGQFANGATLHSLNNP